MKQVELNKILLPNGETIAYREREGGQEVLILIHGNMTSSKHWDVLIDQLDSVYKVYAPDLRGFGRSSYEQPIDSLRDFSEDLKAFVDHLGLVQFSLVGWSTGGGVVMHFAADYPEYVHKLILLESLSTRGYPFFLLDTQGQIVKRIETKEEMAQDTYRTLPISAAYRKRDADFLKNLWNSVIYTQKQPNPEQYAEYVEDMCTQRNLVDIYYANNRFNISHVHNGLTEGSKAVDLIKAPTLILWGEYDLVVTEQMTREIVDDFGSKAQLVVLRGCGHSPLIDDLAQLTQRIEEFLKA